MAKRRPPFVVGDLLYEYGYADSGGIVAYVVRVIEVRPKRRYVVENLAGTQTWKYQGRKNWDTRRSEALWGFVRRELCHASMWLNLVSDLLPKYLDGCGMAAEHEARVCRLYSQLNGLAKAKKDADG